MPTPKSPLDKPSTSSSHHHARRPSLPRRSSSEKSSKSSKHGKSGHSSKNKDSMSDAAATTTGAPTPVKHGQSSRSESEDATRQKVQEGLEHSRDAQDTEASESDAVQEDKGTSLTASGLRDKNAAELERLRAAMDAQLQLNQHREKLARQMDATLKEGDAVSSPIAGRRTKFSPIHEESISPTPSFDGAFVSPLPSALDTASTESARTIRGGMTPSANIPRTPSYPFPSMRAPRQSSWTGHRPFTALSPTVVPSNYPSGVYDHTPREQVMSGSATPGSGINFQPPGGSEPGDEAGFESPNLYDLSLQLASEPGLDAWWTTVVQILRDSYKAERIALAVPADSTDIENVPWGQKATYNALHEDELSLAYLQRGSSFIPSSSDTNETSNSGDVYSEEPLPSTIPTLTPNRPGLMSRHSFTAYEDTKREHVPPLTASRNTLSRPSPIVRAKSYLAPQHHAPPRTATLQNAELSLQALESHLASEGPALQSISWEDTHAPSREYQGRVFPVLQALDYEADPLIDSSGVLRVLERGKVVALTRDYPYLEDAVNETSGGSQRSVSGGQKSSQDKVKRSRTSSFLGQSRRANHGSKSQSSDKGKSIPTSASQRGDDDNARPPTPRYEEYEQAPPSPWAQSPAPSPAIRAETAENPFFVGMHAEDESFNSNPASPQDYSRIQQVEAIGIDRSWTVLHVPLIHPLLSKSVQSFRLDAAAMELRTAARARGADTAESKGVPEKAVLTNKSKEKKTPIAILSILTSVIPYPSNLRHSLMHLAPHLATSFSLCRHYANLETEIAGLSRKRPAILGFGAVAADQHGEGLENITYSPIDESGPQRSTGGSMTSPSDYSGISRSAVGSPLHTPGWDPGSIGFSRDRRSSDRSPAYNATGESYFSSKTRPGMARVDTHSGSSVPGARHSSKDSSPVDSRSYQSSRDGDKASKAKSRDDQPHLTLERTSSRGSIAAAKQGSDSNREQSSRVPSGEIVEARDSSPSRRNVDQTSPRRQAFRTISGGGPGKSEKQHTQLHSYGADYGATFQSLPNSTTPAKPTAEPGSHSRSGSVSATSDAPQHMLPPSDRVKSLMLDSLPAHVFVALAVTGEIVWVNNRYLNYRGQTVLELYGNPWGAIHPEDREEYLKAWSHAVRTGEQFSKQVRIRRFDGNYRWFYTRAVGHRDVRGVIKQWYGSHMDIHDQHIAELKAARQEEIEASEAKHRQLANLIPQIIFAATEDEGVTFANEQWLSYTGQAFEDALGIGFMDFVHPEDLAKCSIPALVPGGSTSPRQKKPAPTRNYSQTSSGENSSTKSSNVSEAPSEATAKGGQQNISRQNSSGSSSFADFPVADLSQLARSGIIKASMDSNGRISYTTEVRLRSKSGEYRWHLVRCVEVDNISLGSGDGSWFGACTDINDHKLLETKLKEAMDSKTRFLSNMSHEIRTPLIGISGMVNFLQDTTLNDEQMDYANTINASAKSLLNIINDILDLSKVDAGMMKLSYDWFHPRSLVEEVNEMVCTMAITKRLELNYIVETDVPEMVKGDKFRIRQILLNVVGNAIKFTTTGEIFSRCRVISHAPDLDDNDIMLEFSVIDTGRGFTKSEAELIFKPFSQIDGSSTRQHGGSGLGLVISRTLVELHGGKMEGTAIPEKGSTFVFTAKFGLPTLDDHPDPPITPQIKPSLATRTSSLEGGLTRLSQGILNPALASKGAQGLVDSPRGESNPTSPAVVSSGGSTPSSRSIHSHVTQRSSGSSVPPNFSHFGEAARSGSQDLTNMKFAIPSKITSPPANLPTFEAAALAASSPLQSFPIRSLSSQDDTLQQGLSGSSAAIRSFRPPMYSILLICPQTHSREATTQHIENTLPKDVPHQITALATVAEGEDMISGDDPINFTHIVLNLGSAEEIVSVIEKIKASSKKPLPSIVILSDPVERQEVIKLGASYDYEQLAKENAVTFIYKPVKPSRFAVVFDPDKERDLSTDRNRFTAQQQVASQKQNYLDVAKRLGNKGFRVLLVEDNLVNQKVLLKYLSKIGIIVELALDGVECIEKVLAKSHDFYSLILCDLHMPRKDGYQTCREIRQWEKKHRYTKMPIIALSANVMADVLEKCVQAGFSNYVTKPVDFRALSSAMGDLLDPVHAGGPPALMKQ